jgi:hypothetical protein
MSKRRECILWMYECTGHDCTSNVKTLTFFRFGMANTKILEDGHRHSYV